MEITKSYRIWFSPRTGSTLLCKGLESTGVAGIPLELFNINDNETLKEKYQVNNYQDLKQKLWGSGTTPNGVFGIKHSLFSNLKDRIIGELAELRNIRTRVIQEEAIWSDLFPNSKHIFLLRRNKVRQAVSWWKAIKDETWHLESHETQEQDEKFYEEHYDFDALSHLFKEANLRECATQAYFSKNKIVPLTIVYEDYILDFEKTILKILDYLEIDASAINVGEKFYKKTASDLSEIWVDRFRYDLQKGWGKMAW